MTRNFFGTFLVVCFGLATQVNAQFCESPEAQIFDVGGFTISGNKTTILSQNRFTQFSVSLGEAEVVNKITRLITSVNPNPRGSASPRALAQKIYDSSEAYGVDPIIYAAKIWQESGHFNVDVVAPGGDTGLSQMTGSGLNEIKEQYKKLNSRNAGERQVGNVLASLSQNYFGTPQVTNQWVDWAINTSNNQKKRTLVQSVDYALAAGASLFKIYLAVKNGNYRNAINQYNGGGVSNYFGRVDGKADHLRNNVNFNCQLSEVELQNLDAICAIVGTDEGCESMVQEILPESVKTYDI